MRKVQLGGYTKDEVEHLTGCIPLFLEKCVVNGEIDLNTEFFWDIRSQAKAFEEEILKTYRSPTEFDWYGTLILPTTTSLTCLGTTIMFWLVVIMALLRSHRRTYQNSSTAGIFTTNMTLNVGRVWGTVHVA